MLFARGRIQRTTGSFSQYCFYLLELRRTTVYKAVSGVHTIRMMRGVGWSIVPGGAPGRWAGTSSFKRHGFRIGRSPGRFGVTPTEQSSRALCSRPGMNGGGRMYRVGRVPAVDAADAVTRCSLLVRDVPLYAMIMGAVQMVTAVVTIVRGGQKGGMGVVGDDDDPGRVDNGTEEAFERAPFSPSSPSLSPLSSTSSPAPSSLREREFPFDLPGVWASAWAPLGGRERRDGEEYCDGCDLSQGVSWIGNARKDALWVGAIDPWRIGGLLRVCLEELEGAIEEGTELEGGVGGTGVIDEMLACLARDVAARWLGYIPSSLKDEYTEIQGAMGGSTVDGRAYQAARVGGSQRGVVYRRVLRLLQLGRLSKGDEDVSSFTKKTADISETKVPVSWMGHGDAPTSAEPATPDTLMGAQRERLYRVAPFVLHDMVMHVADRVCGAYVHDVVAGGYGLPQEAKGDDLMMGDSFLWPAFLDPRLGSTRDVQRFINRLYLRRLVEDHVLETVAIYEDRLPLIRFVSDVTPAGRSTLVIRRSTVRTRRYHELSSLRGFKYAVSLLVECYDVLRPMLAHFQRWIAGMVSWVLKEVVGKGLGFVWEGMRTVRPRDDGARRGPRTENDVRGRDNFSGGSHGVRDDDAWPEGVFV